MAKNADNHSEERFAPIAGSGSTRIPILAVVGALSFTVAGAMFMVIQLYLKELGAQPMIISLNATLVNLGLLLGSLLFGVLADRFSKKVLLVCVLLASTLTIGLPALGLTASGILPVVFFRALFVTGVVPISMTIVSSTSLARKRGRNLSYLSSARALGMTLGTALAGVSLVVLGFKGSFLAFAVLPLLAVPLACCLPRTVKRTAPIKVPYLESLRHTKLTTFFAASAFTRVGALGSLSLGYVYMASLGIPETAMGVVSALGVGIAIPGMLLFGHLADQMKRQRLFLTGLGMSVFIPLIFAWSRNICGMAAGYLTLGISFSAFYMGSVAHIGDIVPPERHGQMLGLLVSSMGLGGVLGPLVAGATAASFGFRGMFFTLAGIAAVGFLLAVFGKHDIAPYGPEGSKYPNDS
jgi:MFS family permease